MSAAMVALFLGLGSGAWIYSRIYGRTGGNSKSALLTGGLCGAAIFLISFIIFLAIL